MQKLNLALTSSALFMDTLNALKDPKTPTLTEADVELVSIKAISEGSFNSEVTVKSLGKAIAAGTSPLKYTRIAITDVLTGEIDVDVFTDNGAIGPADVTVETFRTYYQGVTENTLDAKHIAMTPADGDGKVVFTINDHFGIYGNVSVIVPEKKQSLSDAFGESLSAFEQ